MHELSLVLSLLDQVERELHEAPPHSGVAEIRLSVGRLSGVHVDSMRFAFEAVKPGTVAERAELVIDEPPAESECKSCGAVETIDNLWLGCPVCGSRAISIRGGRELLLRSIELETEEEASCELSPPRA